ncbi:hypothetical protein CMV_012405 [Castanea mollissima]|uniref:Uncharacterized protein n=1 Tax=Castanea mollissima TaxID=60419 RepID=A0A8J4REV4_9ROSI|nr:hypothetical protein CMV_012405 [Castanea mollissima]
MRLQKNQENPKFKSEQLVWMSSLFYKSVKMYVVSMAAANAGQIDHAQPGPIDQSVLTLQANHRSEAIWNEQDPGSLKCRVRSEEFSDREPMVDDRVVDIIKALGSRANMSLEVEVFHQY